MKFFYPLCCLTLTSWLSANQAAGQGQPRDSSLLAAATTRLTSLQMAPAEGNSNLYNGTEYVRYEKTFRSVKGHQFFQAAEELTGNIFYDGALYTNVPLQYDIRYDQLVLRFPQSPYQLKLHTEKVGYFTVNRHRFVQINGPAPATAGALVPGFYDVLYEGRTRVLAKRIKKIQETLTGGGVELAFLESNRFFLEKEGKPYPISGKGDLLTALADKKKELRQFVSAQKLSFNKDQQEASFVKLARYYDTLR
ncbi:hypothetical protein [Hymenobacter cellulosilyticus]|uniref:DUF4369 domain-containing protein n=1 Tax=Hymenobacter cellulosilyticus TaxID=2932248 RepID=A0A8T9Q5N7_9BACT|nr:hypothetical protein [Hymenobacter cellulosilyticus]UOQ71268.1 hypothetical protein MUN79_21865 [Hymenobacter cellulosilyticus]